MDEKILLFISKLRRGGISITIGETIDCLEAVKMLGFEKDKLYSVLKATLVKDAANYDTFDRVFKYFFNPGFFLDKQIVNRRLRDYIKNEKKQKVNKLSDEKCSWESNNNMGGSQKGKGKQGKAANDFVKVIQLGSIDDMSELVRQGIESIEFTEKELHDREDAIRQIKVFLEWKIGENILLKEMAEIDESTRLDWLERLTFIEEMLQEQFDHALLLKFGDEALNIILERTNLNNLDFYRMNNNQVLEIKKKVTKLAHKLATRVSFRETRSKHGKVDIQRSIRKSMAMGGIPIKLAYKKKKPSRPEIIILCDISGSVKIFSEFLLQMVFSMQTRFIHVRSFVFIDIVDEATEFFKNKEVDDAVKDMYNNCRFTNSDFSDYGNVFQQFYEKYNVLLSKKTTIIILGDARNNYNRDKFEYLAKIKESCKRLIWLNPEPIEDWNKEDSIIRVYAPIIDNLFECRNLSQLEKISKEIF